MASNIQENTAAVFSFLAQLFTIGENFISLENKLQLVDIVLDRTTTW